MHYIYSSAMQTLFHNLPTDSLAKGPVALEELMLLLGLAVWSFVQQRNYKILTELLTKLFFFAISILCQNEFMFNIMIRFTLTKAWHMKMMVVQIGFRDHLTFGRHFILFM